MISQFAVYLGQNMKEKKKPKAFFGVIPWLLADSKTCAENNLQFCKPPVFYNIKVWKNPKEMDW